MMPCPARAPMSRRCGDLISNPSGRLDDTQACSIGLPRGIIIHSIQLDRGEAHTASRTIAARFTLLKAKMCSQETRSVPYSIPDAPLSNSNHGDRDES